MGADGLGRAAGREADAVDSIKFLGLNRPHPDMARRIRELGFCHLLIDARESKGEISLIGRDIFRAEERRPLVDEIHMSDGDVPAELVRGG